MLDRDKTYKEKWKREVDIIWVLATRVIIDAQTASKTGILPFLLK